MNFQEYNDYIQSILSKDPSSQTPPYNQEDYYKYTKLNASRMKRWLKTGVIHPELQSALAQIQSPQQWIVITEPWCGDAAHSVPFMQLAASQNPHITLSFELRDSEPYRILSYLTGKSKSIPKLIIQDASGNDLAVWGPRPAECQAIYDKLIEEKADFETIITQLQNWYNENEGKDIQLEIAGKLTSITPVNTVQNL